MLMETTEKMPEVDAPPLYIGTKLALQITGERDYHSRNSFVTMKFVYIFFFFNGFVTRKKQIKLNLFLILFIKIPDFWAKNYNIKEKNLFKENIINLIQVRLS